MKKILRSLFLSFAICSLVLPIYTYAEEPDNGGGQGTVTPTPSPTPSPSPSPSPEPSQTPEPTATPTPTPEEKTDTTLSSLKVNDSEIIKTGQTSYSLVLKNEVNKIKIEATATDSKASISGDIGEKTLDRVGVSTFAVTVSVPGSGMSSKYDIKVTRVPKAELSNITLQGVTLVPVAGTDNKYTANIPYNMSSVNLDVRSTIIPDGVHYTIDGAAKLNVGTNTIKITAYNDAKEDKEYFIEIIRGREDDLLSETESTTSSSGEVNETTDNAVVAPVSKDDNNSSSSKKSGNMQYVFVVISCVVLLIIAILGIVFFIRSGDSDKKKQKRIAKLKKKQERIEEELTSLLPVITEEDEQNYLNSKEEENSSDDNQEYQEEATEVYEEIPEPEAVYEDYSEDTNEYEEPVGKHARSYYEDDNEDSYDYDGFQVEEINFEDTIEMDPIDEDNSDLDDEFKGLF